MKFTTGKNRKTVTVPLHPIACSILDRYAGSLPRISNQRANDYLAEALEAAGIFVTLALLHGASARRLPR